MLNDFLSEYWDIKNRNKKCLRTKKNSRQEMKCSIKTSNNEVYELNLNKNKNWSTKKNLEKKISLDPEYGKITKIATKLEIEIYHPSDCGSKQIFTFFNQKIVRRKKNQIDQQFKDEIFKQKKKSFNQEKKRKNEKHLITYDSDYSLIFKKSIEENKHLVNRTLINIKNLAYSIDDSNVFYESIEGPIQFEKIPTINLPQETIKNFTLIYSRFECPICCEFSEVKLQLTECEHGCCVECWKSHILSKFYSFEIECCFSNCGKRLSFSFLECVLPKKTYEKYLINFKNEILSKKFIKCPKCNDNYISVKNQPKYMRCLCGHSVCFLCKQESHFPISCKQYNFFVQNFQNNKKDLIMVGEVKKCPKCYSILSKNGGCDHMRCVCSFNFNWSSINSFRLFYNHKINCLVLDKYSIDEIDPFISSEMNIFRRFFLLELSPKLNNKECYLKKLMIDPNFCELKLYLKKNFRLNENTFLSFVSHIIDFSFNFIKKICRIVEMIYAKKLIEIHEKIQDQGLLEIVRRLNKACLLFDKAISQKFNMKNFNFLIFVLKKIFKLLNKLNN